MSREITENFHDLRPHNGGPIKTELIHVWEDLGRSKKIWESLEAYTNSSYFLSWGWIENWISSLPDHAKPELVVFLEGNVPFLAFFLGKVTLIRKNLIKSRGWFVNSTGIPAFDRIYIEYNGFLCNQQEGLKISDILAYLPDSWDEFYLPGLDIRTFPGKEMFEKIYSYNRIIDSDLLSPYIDLDTVRAKNGDYLSLLSSNTRSQIKRAYRLCEKIAPVRLEIAPDTQAALNIYYELIALHEDTWKKRSKEGAFSSPYLFQFHERLIQNRFKYNEIQLLRIKCADNTIGCLYNFVYKKNVYFYQSGTNYSLDKHFKPGLLAHAEAVKHNSLEGYKTYDFLGGSERYKTSLATHHNRLIWVRLQKPLFRFKIERALKKLRNTLVELHSVL